MMNMPNGLNIALTGLRSKLLTRVFCATLMLLPMSVAISQTCSIQSPPHTVALLELYTSEGCSSCPPADQFVSGFRTISSSPSGLGPQQVVPLSLHVDYWEYIGWKDIFAQPEFAARQRWLSGLAGSRTIYTPEIFVSGQEQRGWNKNIATTIKQINSQPAQAEIQIKKIPTIENKRQIEVRATATQESVLFVALYENDLLSNVKAGENHGITLKHDYVVRQLIGPVHLVGDVKNGKQLIQKRFLLPSSSQKLEVAVFVQNTQGKVLQALAYSMCE